MCIHGFCIPFFQGRALLFLVLIFSYFSVELQMAIAAVAHIFVFSAEPYRYIPVSACGVAAIETVKEAAEVKEGKDKKSALVEKMETHVEAPGTSVTESVQNIVLEGGQRVSNV